MTLSTVSVKVALGRSTVFSPFASEHLKRLCPHRLMHSSRMTPNVVNKLQVFSSSAQPTENTSREIIWKKTASTFLSVAMSRINPTYSCSRLHLNGIQSISYSTQTLEKKLPIGVQSLKKIIDYGYIYVDKTPLIHQLITKGSWYFLARPKRFGKSLLVDTLNNVFRGEKLLFQDLAINSLKYDWKVHPVIHLDFTHIPRNDSKILREALERRLQAIAHEYQVTINVPTIEEGLIDLVSKLAQKTSEKVVILIDDYDKPVTDHFANIEIGRANRTLLQGLYTTIKGLDARLRFVFITGTHKFSQESLLSGLNNLIDITMSPDYACLVGYTEDEIRSSFKEDVLKLARVQKQTPEQIIERMRYWYNGYRFSREDRKVYHPSSTLHLFSQGKFGNYCFETAMLPFLIEQIKKKSYNPGRLSGIEVSETLFSTHDLEQLSIPALMWQTGYLTIHSYDAARRRYCLDYPNREVQEKFLLHLAGGSVGGK